MKAYLLHKRLLVTLGDLTFAQSFARYLLKKGLHYNPWEKRGQTYIIQAAFTASLIVFYSRPLTRSYGMPDLPKELMTYNAEEWELHNKIIKLRHTVYAHSDSSSYGVKPVMIGSESTSIVSAPFFKLPQDDLSMLNNMIDKLLCEIDKRQKILEKEIAERQSEQSDSR